MGKPKVLELTGTQRIELKKGLHLDEKYWVSIRCRAVLLRVDRLFATLTRMSFVSVNAWGRWCREEGMAGLYIHPNCGRRPIIGCKGAPGKGVKRTSSISSSCSLSCI
jgi:hypothetical protein